MPILETDLTEPAWLTSTSQVLQEAIQAQQLVQSLANQNFHLMCHLSGKGPSPVPPAPSAQLAPNASHLPGISGIAHANHLAMGLPSFTVSPYSAAPPAEAPAEVDTASILAGMRHGDHSPKPSFPPVATVPVRFLSVDALLNYEQPERPYSPESAPSSSSGEASAESTITNTKKRPRGRPSAFKAIKDYGDEMTSPLS